MKKSIIYLLLLLVLPKSLLADATKTVGSTGADYTTLKAAFDEINAGTITGAITLQIISNTTESLSAVLNASGSGSADYTSVAIFPTVSGISITGNLASPLIDLNGADNVTIDGSVNHAGTAKDMTIDNTSTSATAGTSTIRFRNDATGNAIKFCTLKGSETVAASGILFFSTTTGTTGNNGNIIDNNDITSSADASRPINAIYSLGTAALENSGNTISDNNIYDFLNHGVASNGIFISTNSSGWTISGNSFYETTTFVPVTSVPAVTYYIIRINNTGGNYSVSDNFIGGSSSSCGGSAWTKTNAFNNAFYGIHLTAGTATSNNIQNNTIRNVDWSNSLNGLWTGIHVARGDVNVGTVTGNTIGAATGTGSVLVTCTTTANNVYGINIASTGMVNCLNNIIGSITLANPDANGCNFYGINKTASAGTTTISNNTIGSTSTANSIFASSGSTGYAQTVRGIYNAGTGTITISGNTIANLTNGTINATTTTVGRINGIFSSSGTNTISNNQIYNLTIGNANNLTNLNASICGISLSGPTLKNITGNTIYNLSNTNDSFTGNVIGLFFTGSTGSNTITRNFIHSFSVSSSSAAAFIYGIKINAGASTWSNNIISLDGNTATTLYGIYETGTAANNNNLYFNTVYIGGSPASGTNSSYALYSAVNTNTRDFRNNILMNARSTTGGTNLHYAAYVAATGGTLTCDYNDYWVSGTGGILGYFGANKTTLPLVTGQDGNSQSADPVFVNAGGTSATDYLPGNCSLVAITVPGITDDYTGAARPGSTLMGAFHVTPCLRVEVYKSSVFQAAYLNLKKAFDAFNSGTHNTGSFEIKITGDIFENSSAVLNASGTGSANYSSIIIFPTKTGITISGSLAAPLIDLNGADNVTIDGRVNATGTARDMTITNISTDATSGTSTIRLINTATNNSIKYCRLKGSETAVASGILFLSTSTGTTGNNGNTIENNDITNSANVNRPVNAIYSEGTATLENSFNKIRNNNIYDFLNQGITSNGIYISTNNSGDTISGNSFYETASFVPAATVPYYIIRINNTGGNYSVSDNFIGGSASECGGIAWTKTNVFNNIFYGIHLTAGTATSNSIQNNTIRNFDWSNSLNGAWTGIHVARGDVNIGTVTGNTIGAVPLTGSILLTSKTTGNNVYGINIASPGNVSCLNNKIGSITVANADANASNFYGINKTASAGTTTISRNLIGSVSTANSISASSGSTGNAQTVRGISNAGSGTVTISSNTIANLTNGTINGTTTTVGRINGIFSSSGINTISNNQIYNLTIGNANNQTNLNASVCGISLSGPTLKNITGNTIYNLSNTNVSFTGNVIGLFFMGSTGNNTITRNFIHSLAVSSSSASIYGIQINTGASTYLNNIITLGGNTATTIYGIYETGTAGNNNNIYFNTVSICGSPASGTNKSYSLYSAVSTNTRNFRNNIFVNTRSTTGGTNLHYAMYIAATGGTITCDYNDYWVSGTGGTLGYYGANKTTLPIVTGKDVASQSADPVFSLACGTNPSDCLPGIYLQGVAIAGITTDFGGNPRIIPTMGAWEGFVNKWKGETSTNWNDSTNWVARKVPGIDANIIFDAAPLNNCVLDQDRSVKNITDSSAFSLLTNGHKLTIKGNLYFSSGPKIDATSSGSILEFAGDTAQIIEDDKFLDKKANNLLINNISGVLLNSDFTVDNTLTINSGTILTIAAPKLLTVSGTLTNNAGTAGLVIKSDANGNDGKLINNTPSVPATVELYLSGGDGSLGPAFHYIIPPVGSMNIGTSVAEVNTNLGLTNFEGDLLSYNEQAAGSIQDAGWQYFDGYDWGYGNTTPFSSITSSEGYNIFLTANDTINFKGQLNATAHSFNLSFTNLGWNLVGNPYPCNLDLNGIPELTGSGDGVDNTIYFNHDGGYAYWNVITGGTSGYSDILPPMQGFFVEATASGSSLNIPVTAKTGSAAEPVRSKGADTDDNPVKKIKLVLNNGKVSDETIVCLIDKATSGFDSEYDAHKLFTKRPDINYISTELNGLKYAINTVAGPVSAPVIIPVRLDLKTGGTFKINVTEFENLDGIKVVLKHGSVETILNAASSYTFTSKAGTFTDFELIIGGNNIAPATKEKTQTEQFKTWYNNNFLYINCPSELSEGKGKLIIYDTQGVMLHNSSQLYIVPGQTIQLPLNLTRGLYITNVIYNNKRFISKFVVY